MSGAFNFRRKIRSYNVRISNLKGGFMDKKNIMEWISRCIKLIIVMAIVYLILNPIIWIMWGWAIMKVAGLAILGAIVSRIVFKKGLIELITDVIFYDK